MLIITVLLFVLYAAPHLHKVRWISNVPVLFVYVYMKLKFYPSNISYESIYFYSCDQLKKEGRSFRHTLSQLFCPAERIQTLHHANRCVCLAFWTFETLYWTPSSFARIRAYKAISVRNKPMPFHCIAFAFSCCLALANVALDIPVISATFV